MLGAAPGSVVVVVVVVVVVDVVVLAGAPVPEPADVDVDVVLAPAGTVVVVGVGDVVVVLVDELVVVDVVAGTVVVVGPGLENNEVPVACGLTPKSAESGFPTASSKQVTMINVSTKTPATEPASTGQRNLEDPSSTGAWVSGREPPAGSVAAAPEWSGARVTSTGSGTASGTGRVSSSPPAPFSDVSCEPVTCPGAPVGAGSVWPNWRRKVGEFGFSITA